MILQVCAISGSLRRGSSNTELLRAAALLAPASLRISVYEGLAALPAFNPDRELEEIPPVLELRAQLQGSQAVIFSTPEYAHGVPGALKNALDWIVGTGELSEKPAAFWNTSPRASIAQAQLRETVATMNARLVDEACLALALMGKPLEARAIADHPDHAKTIRAALGALERSTAAHPTTAPAR